MLVPKFRAWDKVKRKMYDVAVIYPHTKTIVLQGSIFDEPFLRGFNDVVLMQSTGLIDPQGVEVFEGDVLYYPENPEGEKYGLVVWQKESLAFVLETAFDYLPYNLWLVGAVVGNIYENPELRKVVE